MLKSKMKPKFPILSLIALASLLTACTKTPEATIEEALSPKQLLASVEFCILKETGIDGYSGFILTPPKEGLSPDAPITASNSYYGKENRMTVHFLGNDGTQDFYRIETHFPGEPDKVHEVAYEGNELVVRRFENIEMRLRPFEPKS